MTEPSHAVFLSYASQDAAAAQRICEALRAAGIEVWFDQSELRGGDAWDRSIRRQIKSCALFIPLISRNTHDRDEGYFRLEWKLAVDRRQLMAADRTFLLPVVVDATRDDDERVPDPFREVQWTRLPAGETPASFVARVQRLLAPETPVVDQRANLPSAAAAVVPDPASVASRPRRQYLVIASVVVLAAVIAYFVLDKHRTPQFAAPSAAVAARTSSPAAFAPPQHSIAVLPFVNMSGEKDQEYFSEGLSEELLDSLSQINGLQVAARTSSFSFKDKDVDIATIAHKLNVASVLEGSVRRSANRVRISAQLVNAVTGFHLWSQSYDRDLGDVLALQTEIATSVAQALRVTLLGDVGEKIELGGTHNPAALDAYLRASKTFQSRHDTAKEGPIAIAAYTEAIQLDPNFALAFAGRSLAITSYTEEAGVGPARRDGFAKAESDARRAIALTPDLARGHLALASVMRVSLDFAQASQEHQRALALRPGDTEVLRASGESASYAGHVDTAIATLRRVAVLDPLERRSYTILAEALYNARRYEDAVKVFGEAATLDPDFVGLYGLRGLALYGLGQFENARSSCEDKREFWLSQQCLAMVYRKLGRSAEADAMLAKMKAALGEDAAYQYAAIYSQWGDRAKALEWLDTAMRLRDPGLIGLKVDPLMDPVRNEPRFQAMLLELRFPP